MDEEDEMKQGTYVVRVLGDDNNNNFICNVTLHKDSNSYVMFTLHTDLNPYVIIDI